MTQDEGKAGVVVGAPSHDYYLLNTRRSIRASEVDTGTVSTLRARINDEGYYNEAG